MEQKIKNMIKKVKDRKEELIELKGEKNQIQKQMENEGCSTVEQLDEEISKEITKGKKITNQMEEEFQTLEKDYDWN